MSETWICVGLQWFLTDLLGEEKMVLKLQHTSFIQQSPCREEVLERGNYSRIIDIEENIEAFQVSYQYNW